jgi:beta-lactam-binding protein with PASTA domain
MFITLILVVAVAVGVFIFVKNNPNKTKQINDAAKKLEDEIKDKLKK